MRAADRVQEAVEESTAHDRTETIVCNTAEDAGEILDALRSRFDYWDDAALEYGHDVWSMHGDELDGESEWRVFVTVEGWGEKV